MKRIFLLLGLALWSACQSPHEVTPVPKAQQLTEIGENQLPINFYAVNLSARTSSNTLTISSSVEFDIYQLRIQEFGFCLSQTDSLPQISKALHRRVKATSVSNYQTYSRFETTIPDVTPGQTFFIDPYIILADGQVLYGRYNQTNRASTRSFSAIRFQLPQRPVLSPVQLVARATVPTPPGVSNTSPIPNFHQFFTMKGRLYSFYPTGALHAYDAQADRWDPMAELGQSVFGTSPIVFTVDDKLYVHSSPNYWYGASRPQPAMWEYDPSRNQWTDLGTSLGENLFNSQFQLSADGKAYFYRTYPYGILAFDARQKQTYQVEKAGLLANIGSKSFVLADNNQYYNLVWVPGGSVAIPGSIKTRLIQYNPATDQVTEATQLSTQLRQQQYDNLDFLIPQRTDLLIGFGSTVDLLLSPGSVGAAGLLYKDELVRYSTQEQKVTAYYDLSGLPNSQAYSQVPILIDNRLFIFNASTDKGLFTEVVFK